MARKARAGAFTKAVNEETREVEQIVSVFNNVDLGGDRVREGAFIASLAKWMASNNVLPVYFSHQWDRPEANIGSVVEAKELAPGDPLLPEEVSANGGLYVRYKVDDKPFANDVFDLLKERRLTQASFAYDVVRQKKNSDGTNDLLELDLIEVGPTLLGMNPETTLLSAKDIRELEDALAKDNNHTFIPSEQDPSRCGFPDCGKTQSAVAHINRLSRESATKAQVSFSGSMEQRQEAVYRLVNQWAYEGDVGNGGFYCAYLEATFDDHVIFLVEGWDDPPGQGEFFQASYTESDDGVSIESPQAVSIEPTVVPKARRKALSYEMKRLHGIVVLNDEDHAKSDGKAEEPGAAKAEDQTKSKSKSETEAKVATAKAKLQLLTISEER